MIYLDACATTQTDPRALDAMLPFFGASFGNPGSRHARGQHATQAIARARRQVADALGARPKEIVFTSGATEAINIFLRGVAATDGPTHIISVATEHKATLSTLDALSAQGIEVTLLPVDSEGLVDLEDLRAAFLPHTRAVAIMWVNNETGVLQPIEDLVRLTHEHGALFFCDATQAFGKIPIDLVRTPIDALAISSHKVHGPPGIGALYLPRRTARHLQPILTGGGQERGFRPGTPPTPLIVGFGVAASLLNPDDPHLATLRDQLTQGLLKTIPHARVHGALATRAPHCVNICIPGIRAETLVLRLSERVAISTGSACNALTPEPSHVLLAMGIPPHDAHASIRLSVDQNTTPDDIKQAIHLIYEALQHIQKT